MDRSRRPASIAYASLTNEASSYNSLISKDMQELEDFCREAIPRTLSQRRVEGPAFLTKSETQRLLEWKLLVSFDPHSQANLRVCLADDQSKHGKYRPNLPKLLASNSDKDVENTTKDAFEVYLRNTTDFKKALDVLVKLKGIGPATASLILSRFDREIVPFFSDELFRWIHFEDGRTKGWDRKISYSTKEYLSLYEKVFDLRTRLDKESGREISAEDVEKAAYAIFKRRASDTTHAQAEASAKGVEAKVSRKHGRAQVEDVQALVVNSTDTTKPRRKRRKP